MQIGGNNTLGYIFLFPGYRDIPKESRKLIKWHVDDVMNWLRTQQSANYEDYINRLTHLTREVYIFEFKSMVSGRLKLL